MSGRILFGKTKKGVESSGNLANCGFLFLITARARAAMFSLLAAAHGAHHVEITCTSASFCGLGAYEKSDDFSGHSMLASMPVGLDTAVSPELLSKEKLKAKQGYCETALWNCNDLWGP